jgi:hypothetical protein
MPLKAYEAPTLRQLQLAEVSTSMLMYLGAKALKGPIGAELAQRGRFLEHAAADVGGHIASRRTLLIALGEIEP